MKGRLPEIQDEDLREIFALFMSATKHERDQIYDTQGAHSFGNEDLCAEYSLTQAKKEFAWDAWRAVISFLNSNGYSACKDGVVYDLSFIERAFID